MNKQTKFIIFAVLIIIVVGIAGFFLSRNNIGNGNKLDSFAQCISNSGAKFYGTFWCPHCQNQKKEFGSSKQYLPYIECSSPNGQDQLPVCKEAGIESYPTWVFADGSVLPGELPFNILSEKTSCPLPEITE